MSDDIFSRQCAELGEKIVDLMFGYPKPVVACVLPGVLASISTVLEIPRETIIQMLDSALEDMNA